MIHNVSRASSSVAPAHAQSRFVFTAVTALPPSTFYAQRAVKQTRTTMPCEPGSDGILGASHIQAGIGQPVSQNARLPCPETGSSSSWPQAYSTYAPQLSRIAAFTALRRLRLHTTQTVAWSVFKKQEVFTSVLHTPLQKLPSWTRVSGGGFAYCCLLGNMPA